MATISQENPKLQINMYLFDGTGSIWNASDWMRLREQRIVGSLIGNIAQRPHQIKEKGLPLLLTKNETTLLLEYKLATLWECPHFLQKPTHEVIESCRAQRDNSLTNQAEELMELRKQEILNKSEVILKGKMSKRSKLSPSFTQNLEIERDAIIATEIEKISRPAESYLLVQTCTEDPWTSIEKLSTQWEYPRTIKEKLEYETFRSLWESGHWITPGGKFGGEFLAYPGDPLLYHARFIIRLSTLDETLSPMDLIAFARLANSTRKTAAIAYFDSNCCLQFQSLTWINE